MTGRAAGNDGFVTPDLIGRLVLPEGKRLPVGAGNDVGVKPAMTVSSRPT